MATVSAAFVLALTCSACVCTAYGAGGAESVVLVEDGLARCHVARSAASTPTESLCAEEMTRCLRLATGCGELTGTLPIRFEISPRGTGDEEGYALDVRPDGVTISGASARGMLYGCYAFLRQHAGMRWLVPGEDGEYCISKRRTLAVPVGRTPSEPVLKVRTIGGDDPETIRWMVRNGMQPSVRRSRFYEADGTTLSERGRLYEALCVRGTALGGHVMSSMIAGTGKGTQQERMERVYAAHPEWFPLVNGRRVKIIKVNDPNPCVSNPGLLDWLAEYLVASAGRTHGGEDYITIGNNDTSVWCQCDACKALDAPEAANTRGARSDRYWHMVNEIARRVWAKRPEVHLGGWAYQDFWYAPVRVKPDPRLRVLVSFNNQCWRHSCLDGKCAVNGEMAKIYAGWKKLGLPLVVNRDEIGGFDAIGAPGCDFLPSERVLARNFRDYAKMGCRGSVLCLNGPFPEFRSFARNWAPYYGKSYHWYAIWQTIYMGARAMWDPSAEFDAALEEANRLYYGAGWEAGMKEFRSCLTDCFLSTPGCIGWGQGVTTGRCLDRPGSEDRLVAALSAALSAAKAAGDERAARHIAREQEIFGLTWLKARKKYVEGHHETTAYRRKGRIVVDGNLDEKDWQDADTYSNFIRSPWRPGTNALARTYVRIVYDRDTLYFGIEAMEPRPADIVAGSSVRHDVDGAVKLGDHLELFYQYPDMNEVYWHLMVNSKGQIIDALHRSMTDRDLAFHTRAAFAAKVLSDRWTLEIAIPCDEIGQNCFDGATWKFNVARSRFIRGMKKHEQSSVANGYFHGVENFVNVKFVPERKGTGAHDASSWQNADFNTLVENARPNNRGPRWKSCPIDSKVPARWNCNGAASVREHADGSGNWYVTLSSGSLSQYYLPLAAGNVRIRFRARGTGRLSLRLSNYESYEDKTIPGYRSLKELPTETPSFALSPEWKDFVVSRRALGRSTERISVDFSVRPGSSADIDDVYVVPGG